MDIRFAFVLMILLLFLDIVYTYKILRLYRIYYPEDKRWPDLEFNKSARWILKKYGLGKKSFMLNVIHTSIFTALFFGAIYILNLDMIFITYAAFGGLAVVNISHYRHYQRLKEMLNEKKNQYNNIWNCEG